MNTLEPAPIALFVYNRLDHTRQTVEALLKNEESKSSDLTIFSDGPKNDGAVTSVNALREYLTSIKGFKSVRVIQHPQNLGLAQSIIGGINQILSASETVIVMEDDLISSPYFLRFMNEALQKYKNQDKVGSILGYCLPLGKGLPETYFLKAADCWGWATWKHAWAHFNENGQELLQKIEQRNLQSDFDLKNTTFYTEMLRGQIDGRNNSWAIRWRASTYLAGLYSLYPGRSLIKNIGFDGTGTHCGELDVYQVELSSSPIQIQDIPIEENRKVRKKTIKFYRSLRISFLKRVSNYAKKKIKQLIGVTA